MKTRYRKAGCVQSTARTGSGIWKAGSQKSRCSNCRITADDLKNIACLGCNVVRAPFWCRNFMEDEQCQQTMELPWTTLAQRYCDNLAVAAYVGEFRNMLGLGICNEYGISWITWTYKGTNSDVGETDRADWSHGCGAIVQSCTGAYHDDRYHFTQCFGQ